MAANLTDFGENALMDGTAHPATLWVKLHAGDPGETGTANPATHTTRASFTRTPASGGAAANVADIAFASLAATQSITHISLWDAASGGNAWWHGPLASPVTGNAGQTLTIPAGDLDLTIT